jgi:deoxyribonuclease V
MEEPTSMPGGRGSIHKLHSWDVTREEAYALQEQLRQQVVLKPDLGSVQRVAGVDVGFRKGQARAAVVLLSFPKLEVVEHSLVEVPVTMPYIPGLLSFREGPAVLAAFDKLTLWPDLVIFDGQGLAHPRRLGLACHLGLFLDLPSIGCAKSRLCGQYEEPGMEKGAWSPLYDADEVIGAVLRSRSGTKPLFVSPGHRVDLETSVGYVLACTPRYRLPETTRQAHRLCSKGGGSKG